MVVTRIYRDANILSVVSSARRYLDPDDEAYAQILQEFRETLAAFSPKTHATLYGIGALEDRFLDLMFRDVFIELLPADVVLRVMDAFLLEGNRILFRYGLAIIRAYKTQIKAGNYQTATSFWHAVKADAVNAATKANTPMLFKTIGRDERLPVVDAFEVFSKAKNPAFLETNLINEYPFDEDRSMVSKMLRPMTLTGRRGSSIAINLASPLAALNSNSAGSSVITTGSQKAQRKASITGLTARPSVTDMFMSGSGTAADGASGSNSSSGVGTGSNPTPVLARRGSAAAMSIKEGMSAKSAKARAASADDAIDSILGDFGASPPVQKPETVFTASAFTSPDPSGGATPASALSAVSPVPGGAVISEGRQLDAEQAASGMAFSSAILTATSAAALLNALPQPIPLGGYHLAFATSQQGYHLSSLYAAVGKNSPILLVVRLAAPYEHIVLGAYLGVALQPTPQCRGNAHTACFRMDGERVQVHRWVGHSNLGTGSGSGDATTMQFVTATNSVLAFGASAEHGTHALRLDESLHLLTTGPSDTFGNTEPLVVATDGITQGYGFSVKEVEVFSALPTSKGSNGASARSAASRVFADITED